MRSSNQKAFKAAVQQDLRDALLQAEGVTCKGTADESFSEESVTVAEAPAAKISYPWNPADLEA
ncbi:hypothetical protein H6F43_09375, partial [Leptolyngbya sp. FACHB-36]|uniref:hypothetical protein n=1 Tax=Leptolyngbya sp. FACHB-36 TaxID=2692808 RepID=UPI001680352D